MQWNQTRAILAGGAVWVTWAIVPSVLHGPGDERLPGLVRAQVGALAEPYLRLAPPATVAFCCFAPLVMMPVLCLLSSAGLLGARPFHAASLTRSALRNLLLWFVFFVTGAAAAFIADLSRGADPDVATSFWWRLSAYGFVASLPGWGLALWARAALPKFWQSVGATVLASLGAGALSLVLRATHPLAPTPLRLRETLFSGQADELARALFGLMLWGAVLMLLTLATRRVWPASRVDSAGIEAREEFALMQLSKVTETRGLVAVIMVGLALAGCGADDDGENDCGSPEAPLVYTVQDITPAPGSTTTNANIVHSFVLKGNDALSKLTGVFTDQHTAGLPTTPLTWSLTSGNDAVTYQATPVSWSSAPAEVRLNLTGTYSTKDGCFYRLPSPMFSYSVTPAE